MMLKPRARPSRLHSVALAGAGALAILWIVFEAWIPDRVAVIRPADIRPERGCAYVVEALRPKSRRLAMIEADGVGAIRGSRLIITENGHLLGPGSAMHDDIRQAGRGAYSHWENVVYFSASDCSDPRSNGRTYTIDRKSTRLNSSHIQKSRMPSSA